jgi:hypothetical protein
MPPQGRSWGRELRSIQRIAAVTSAAALLASTPAVAGTDPGTLELAVKAAYLYKLGSFVTWPSDPARLAAPLAICVQGTDPFGPLLDRAAAGQSVAGRPVVVRRVARLEPDSGCAIAYVAGSAVQSQAQALAAVERAPVLTVTDAARGPTRGIVHLLLDAGKVRFAIDAAKADEAGLAISSKLLALAVVVRP